MSSLSAAPALSAVPSLSGVASHSVAPGRSGAMLAKLPGPALLPVQTPFRDGRQHRTTQLLAIACAHVLVIWAVLQTDAVKRTMLRARPLMVALLADAARPEPTLPDLPRPKQDRPPAPMPLPPPEITVATALPAPPPMPVLPPVQVVLAPAPAPMAVAAPAPALVRPPAPPAITPPAEPKLMPPGTIRYRVQPAIEVPMVSRRLNESGTVLLRVVVDAQGVPRQITVHKSSGFARLDEQALAAMRQARFQPVTEGGAAIEWLVIAPLQYDVD